jgi:hypothetical protein
MKIQEKTKSPCPKCGKKNKTTSELSDGEVWNLRIVTDCDSCGLYRNRLDNFNLQVRSAPQAWSAEVARERIGREADTLQPFKPDGTINEHFTKVYGRGGMYKEYGLSDKKVYEMQEKRLSIKDIER